MDGLISGGVTKLLPTFHRAAIVLQKNATTHRNPKMVNFRCKHVVQQHTVKFNVDRFLIWQFFYCATTLSWVVLDTLQVFNIHEMHCAKKNAIACSRLSVTTISIS